MTRRTLVLAPEAKSRLAIPAFFEDAACSISYRDKHGRWSERTVHIDELGRGHILAKCELRGDAYRRINFGCIRTAKPVAPPP